MPIKKTAPTEKADSKKTSASKKKSESKQELVCANSEQCFWVHDGTVLSNVLELRDTLSKIAEEIFQHHVNDEKNDFADWVQHVLQDVDLAKALRKAKKTEDAYAIVVKRLKAYNV